MIVLRAYATWVTLAVCAGLVLLFRFGDDGLIAEASRVLALAFMLMMMPAFASTAASCYVTPGWPEREQWGGLAMFVLSFCAATSNLISLFYRLSGKPPWILELPITNAWAFGLIVWGATFITAPGFFGDTVRTRTKLAIGGFCIVMIGLVAYLGLVRPDLAPVAAWIEHRFIRGDCG